MSGASQYAACPWEFANVTSGPESGGTMNNNRNNWLGLLVGVASFLVITSAYATDNFVKVRLHKGVSIELPKNWVVISKDKRITLDTIIKSVLDLTDTNHPENSNYVFAANRYENAKTIGIVNVRYYPDFDLSQSDARQITLQEMNELDAALKENMVKSMKALNDLVSIKSWEGTKKKTNNGITTFVTGYSRNEGIKDTGSFRVRLVRVFAGDRSFTLTVSYDEKNSFLLKTITDRIIESLKLSGEDAMKLYPPFSMEALNVAIAESPSNATLYYNRGVLFTQEGKYKMAIDDYSKAVNLNPNFAESYSNRCAVYIIISDFEKALRDCSKSVNIDPNFSEAYFNRAKTRVHLSQVEESLSDMKIAARLGNKEAIAVLEKNKISW